MLGQDLATAGNIVSASTTALSGCAMLRPIPVVVAAGATHVPSGLLRYLRPGGRMVLPLTTAGEGERVQRLTVIDAAPGGFREQALDAVRFVPLLPGLA